MWSIWVKSALNTKVYPLKLKVFNIFTVIFKIQFARFLYLNTISLCIDYLNGVGKPEDDDDINSKEDNTDGSEYEVEGVTFSDDNDDENVDNDEEDSLHSGSENESEEEFSSAGEDSDINGAVGKSDDDDIEEDEDMGNNTIQQFSSTSLKEDIEKGTAAKHQLSKLKNC